ncbi:MAG: hypothetical protein ABI488_11570 [Polyangiaceae bacterium]
MPAEGSLAWPWTDPRDVLRPPESFNQDAFVRAAKGHTEQRGTDLAVIYLPSAFNGESPNPDAQRYCVRLVRIGHR